MSTLGIIGAGKIGGQMARAAIAAGYDIVIANSRGPDSLTDLIAELGPAARAGAVQDVASGADLVLVAIPLKNYPHLPADLLRGKIVIDANNYYPNRDGNIPDLDNGSTTSSELLQKHLANSRIVKTINHIYARDIPKDATPRGSANRRALAVFGDDPAARAEVSTLLDRIGFEPVDAGPLSEGWRLQPGTPGYCVPMTADELRATMAATTR
jgi:8-hydroxy-5-deazaflavin:NADPH oxidoreductase